MLNAKRLLLGSALAGAMAGSACTWNDFYADNSKPIQAVVGFQARAGQAPVRVVLEDLNLDGKMDVGVLLGTHEGYGYGTYDVNQIARSDELVVMLGDGKGGLREASRVPIALGSPLDLKVWKPAADSKPLIALYGVQGSSTYYSAGTPELDLFSLDEGSVAQKATHSFADVTYGTRVDVGFVPGDAPGSKKLLVAQPTMNTGDTGYPVTASVLARPDGEAFSQAGTVANNPHASYDVFTVVDLNDDGRMDTVLTDSCAYTVSLQFSEPDGSITVGSPIALPVQEIPIAAFPHRVDGDARPRIILVSQSAVALYRQENNALVQEQVTRVMGSSVGAIQTDLDADGIQDLVVTSSDGRIALLGLDAQGKVATRRIKDVEIVDEAAATGVLADTVQRLNPAPSAERVTSALTAASGDLDGDGRPDLVLGSVDGRVLVHLGR